MRRRRSEDGEGGMDRCRWRVGVGEMSRSVEKGKRVLGQTVDVYDICVCAVVL